MTRPIALIAVVLAGLSSTTAAPTGDFSFFEPTVVLEAADRARLAGGGTIARTYDAEGNVVIVFAAMPVAVDANRFAAWLRNIGALKRARQVLAIGRFSDPPRLEDLARLTFDDDDLKEVAECRAGDCGLKLTAAEIPQLQRALAERTAPAAQQDAMRRFVLRRVSVYLATGHGALGEYNDRHDAVSVAATSRALIAQSAFLQKRLPQFCAMLARWPQNASRNGARAESFIYWSKEAYGGKPIVSATHVFLLRGDGHATPEVVAIGRQIFATHYLDGSFSVTALVGDGSSGRRYLAFFNRLSIDLFSGFWGGLMRRILDRSLRAEAPDVLKALQLRLESGPPPSLTSTNGRRETLDPRQSHEDGVANTENAARFVPGERWLQSCTTVSFEGQRHDRR